MNQPKPTEAEVKAAEQIISDGWTTVPLAKDPRQFYREIARDALAAAANVREQARHEVWRRNIANMVPYPKGGTDD